MRVRYGRSWVIREMKETDRKGKKRKDGKEKEKKRKEKKRRKKIGSRMNEGEDETIIMGGEKRAATQPVTTTMTTRMTTMTMTTKKGDDACPG